jgi:hypothetical protein
MAEITPATPVEMILYYSGKREEYEEATSQEAKDRVYEEAKEYYKNKVEFDDNGDLVQPDLPF